MHALGWTCVGKHLTTDWTKPTDVSVELSFARSPKPRSSYIVNTTLADVEHEGVLWAIAAISALYIDPSAYLACSREEASAIGLGWAGVPARLYTVVDVDHQGILSATLIMDTANGTVIDVDLFDHLVVSHSAMCA